MLAYVLLVAVVLGSGIVFSEGWRVNEASAIATLRLINSAEVTYASTYHAGFSANLNQLCAPSPGGQPNANAADLLDPERCGQGRKGTATTFVRNAYVFKYVPAAKAGSIATYSIYADPISRGRQGQRSFFTDESGVVRGNATEPATAGDNPI